MRPSTSACAKTVNDVGAAPAVSAGACTILTVDPRRALDAAAAGAGGSAAAGAASGAAAEEAASPPLACAAFMAA